MKAYAVIGAGYGDEGKGAMTDYLTHRLTTERYVPFVARCNGGSQAGHTVVTPDGKRHVFKHHGSGTFTGAPTYLSEDFVANPIIFRMEHQELLDLDCNPYVAISPEAIVTLPMDMMINQALEESRGANRHGSCGMGINETVVRNKSHQFHLRVKHLSKLNQTFLNTQRIYGLKRLEELGLEVPAEFDSELIDEQFLDDVQYFIKNTLWLEPNQLGILGDYVVFEGAQGLGLDQNYGHFPHVTRSNTGLKNMLKLARKLEIPDLETIYVTRCYATRHGSGPLEWEGEDHQAKVVDETNIHNPWQQEFRTAPLDVELLLRRITRDRAGVISIAVTCLDQVEDKVRVLFPGSGITEVSPAGVLQYLYKNLKAKHLYCGAGDTRDKYSC